MLLTVTILGVSICGILLTYINMFMLSDLSRDLTMATNAVQAKMEEVKKNSFDTLSALNGTTFDIFGFDSGKAKGRIEVSDVTLRNPSTETLKKVRIVVCFKSRDRVIGEDANLNGALNTGEDTNNNNRLDGPVELITFIAR